MSSGDIVSIVGLAFVAAVIISIVTSSITTPRVRRRVTLEVRERTQRLEESDRHNYANVNLSVLRSFLALAGMGAVFDVIPEDSSGHLMRVTFQTPTYQALMVFDPKSGVGTIKHLYGEVHFNSFNPVQYSNLPEVDPVESLRQWLVAITGAMALTAADDTPPAAAPETVGATAGATVFPSE